MKFLFVILLIPISAYSILAFLAASAPMSRQQQERAVNITVFVLFVSAMLNWIILFTT